MAGGQAPVALDGICYAGGKAGGWPWSGPGACGGGPPTGGGAPLGMSPPPICGGAVPAGGGCTAGASSACAEDALILSDSTA